MIDYRKKDYTQGHLRNEIVKRSKNQGKTCRIISEELGIGSTSTVSRWNNRDTLESKSSAPKKPCRKYEFEQLYMLYAVKKYLGLPLDDCLEELKEKYNIIFNRSSASYYLNQWKITKKFKSKENYKKFKDYDIGYLHIDITYGPKIDGKKMYIYVAIDRKTRTMYIELHDNKRAKTAKNFLENAIDFFPFYIHTILIDNGKEFTLKNHKGKHDLVSKFDEICDEFDIEHRLTLPYTPKTNGMVEKCNDIIKSNTVGITIYHLQEEMRKDLTGFMLYYNLHRRHGSIVKETGKRTPFEAINYYYRENPELFKQTPEEFKFKLENIAQKNNIVIYQKRRI